MKIFETFGLLLKWMGRTVIKLMSFKSGGMNAPTGIADPNSNDYLYKPKPPEYRP